MHLVRNSLWTYYLVTVNMSTFNLKNNVVVHNSVCRSSMLRVASTDEQLTLYSSYTPHCLKLFNGHRLILPPMENGCSPEITVYCQCVDETIEISRFGCFTNCSKVGRCEVMEPQLLPCL